MSAYKKFFNQLLSYNGNQATLSTSSPAGTGPFEPSAEDVLSDIRVEPDTGGQNQTVNSLATSAVGHKEYRFVLVQANSANVANGTLMMLFDTLATTVTTVAASSIGLLNTPGGVGIGVITAGNKGFVQTKGFHSAVIVASNIAAGAVLIASSTAGTASSTAANTAPTNIPVGVAVAASAGGNTTIAARLLIPV